MSRFGSTEGKGGIKLLLTVVVVGYLILAGAKYGKQRVDHEDLEDSVVEFMKFAGVKEPPWKADDIKGAVLSKAKELEIDLPPENVTVTDDGDKFHTRISYDRPYKIPGYEKKIHWEIDQSWTRY